MKRAFFLPLTLALCFLMALSARAAGQPPRVSLVTVYPGSEIYELEGHTALRVIMPDGNDLAVNFGVFDFNRPNFVYRFVKGETDYLVMAYPWMVFRESYRDSGRRIVEQPLALDSAATHRLMALLNNQLRPENSTYRYNYVLDNCATRPFALIEQAMCDGDTLSLPGTAAVETAGATTFRQAMRFYHKSYPWYQFGIDLALGAPLDRPISRRQQSFAPIALMEQLQGSPILGPGAPASIPDDFSAASLGPTPFWLTPMAAGLALLVLTIALSVYDLRRGRYSRLFDALLFTVYGLAGCIIVFLVFVSSHYATSPNYLLMWLNPAAFIPVIFLWSRRGRKIVYSYQILNFALLLSMTLAWPLLPQSANAAIWPFVGAEALRSFVYIRLYPRLK